MISEQPEQKSRRQRKPITRSHSSQKSPTSSGKQLPSRGCCKCIATIFSLLSETDKPSNRRRLHRQSDELHEGMRRQRDLQSAYEARLERLQDYLRYCMDIAKENGFFDRLLNRHHQSPSLELGHRISGDVALTSHPHLEAIRCQAKLGGWSIEPHEMQFHEKIGEGTTADVYRGTWRGLEVAVKWIHPHYFQENKYGEMWFAQELDTLSRQRHPFVLRFMGACLQTPGNGWLVTELLSGRTLTEWLYGHKERQRARSIPLPPLEERLEKGLEIAQAMQYLHEQKPKLIHRDLKPSNILLDDLMHVRVADFGHARFLPDGEQALTGEMGTYVYMAPEIIRSEPYDEKCDVYSFGIILNELVTCEHPYSDSSFGPSKIAMQVAEGRLRPKLPEDEDRYKELIDLVSCSWNGYASARPSFATIASSLKRIQEKLKRNSDQ